MWDELPGKRAYDHPENPRKIEQFKMVVDSSVANSPSDRDAQRSYGVGLGS